MYIWSAAFLNTLLNITGHKFSNPDETLLFPRLLLPTTTGWGRKHGNLFYSVGPPTFIYGMWRTPDLLKNIPLKLLFYRRGQQTPSKRGQVYLDQVLQLHPLMHTISSATLLLLLTVGNGIGFNCAVCTMYKSFNKLLPNVQTFPILRCIVNIS